MPSLWPFKVSCGAILQTCSCCLYGHWCHRAYVLIWLLVLLNYAIVVWSFEFSSSIVAVPSGSTRVILATYYHSIAVPTHTPASVLPPIIAFTAHHPSRHLSRHLSTLSVSLPPFTTVSFNNGILECKVQMHELSGKIPVFQAWNLALFITMCAQWDLAWQFCIICFAITSY